MNRALRTISKCNEALVRSGNQEDLLREICKTIVEVGEYQLACINLVQKDSADAYRAFFSYAYPDGAAQHEKQGDFSDCWEQFSDLLQTILTHRRALFLNRQDEQQATSHPAAPVRPVFIAGAHAPLLRRYGSGIAGDF